MILTSTGSATVQPGIVEQHFSSVDFSFARCFKDSFAFTYASKDELCEVDVSEERRKSRL